MAIRDELSRVNKEPLHHFAGLNETPLLSIFFIFMRKQHADNISASGTVILIDAMIFSVQTISYCTSSYMISIPSLLVVQPLFFHVLLSHKSGTLIPFISTKVLLYTVLCKCFKHLQFLYIL